MNATPKYLLNCIAATALTFGALGHVAMAAPNGAAQPLTATVNFEDLDISKESGAAALYQRLRTAARQVCAPLESNGDLAMKAKFRSCYRQALSNAVLTVDQVAVTAMHARVVNDKAS